jgi:hypothetical protein
MKFGAFIEQGNKNQQSNHDTNIVVGQWDSQHATTNNYGESVCGKTA